MSEDIDYDQEDGKEDQVQWENDDEYNDNNDDEENSLRLSTETDTGNIESTLSESAFIYGWSYAAELSSALEVMHEKLYRKVDEAEEFDGIWLYTCAKGSTS